MLSAAKRGVLFHTDAVQAVGHIAINVKEQNIDMMSASAHKFHGPKGVGFLYAKKGIRLHNIIEGGAQERGKRAGTENIPGIVGMAAALKEAVSNLAENSDKVTAMRDTLIEGLSKVPHCILNGDKEHRLPGNVNFCFEGIEGVAAAASRHEGNMRIVRLGMHIRLARSEPCTACDRTSA